jgi:hypothetical protein
LTTRAFVLHPGRWLVGLVLCVAGCGCSSQADTLLVASSWPEADRRDLTSAFGVWAAANPDAVAGSAQIRWITLAPGDDLLRVARRRVAPDVILGGVSGDYQRLARAGKLVPIERTKHPVWCVARRGPIGLEVGRRSPRGAIPAGTPTFDDFRRDPVALAWAKGQLTAEGWPEGYAQLVKAAGNRRRIGRQAGAALAAVERGEAQSTPWPAPRAVGRPDGPELPAFTDLKLGDWIEGVGIIRGGSNPSLAQEFIRFLEDRGLAESPRTDDLRVEPDVDPLLADLLGATLVDAQDELWAAWRRLEAAGHPEKAERWMTEAPPWPPASIGRMMHQGEAGAALLETLMAELVPESEPRAWLVRSWDVATRPIDGVVLTEFAGAHDGRLMAEPRLRAWLRSEWTAWARQRYRRVARLAEKAIP